MHKIFKYATMAGILALGACNDIYETQSVVVPVEVSDAIESISVADGQSVDPATKAIQILFKQPVVINSSAPATLNGESVTLVYADESTDRKAVDILVTLVPNTEYVLEVPTRAITPIGSAAWSKGFTLAFNTGEPQAPAEINIQALTNPKATAQAQNVYQYLVDNYGKKMLSGAMGNVNWSTEYTDFIAQETGKYPAVVGFDYLHLPWSADGSWINYGDITPVRKIWEAGSIPAMSWHWNVPTEAPGESVTIWEGETAMGAWSNYIQLDKEADKEAFGRAKVGDVIIVEVSELGSNPQGSFKDASTWAEIAAGTEWFSITGNFSLKITAEILTALTQHGLIIGGQNYTATKVTLGAGGSGGGDYTFNSATAFDPANVMVEGTWENQIAEADVAKVAGYLQLLQDAGIPVLWRPLHEAAGDYGWGPWFWWGNGGVEVTKQLYIWLRHKLEGEYGLNNLIWVWTMQTSDKGQMASVDQLIAAYPGDEYVDIVGPDIYPSQALTDQSQTFNLINKVVRGEKMIALTECGNLVDPQQALENQALWSYFMQWYDMNNEQPGHNNYLGPDQWIATMDSPCVISQGQMPDLK